MAAGFLAACLPASGAPIAPIQLHARAPSLLSTAALPRWDMHLPADPNQPLSPVGPAAVPEPSPVGTLSGLAQVVADLPAPSHAGVLDKFYAGAAAPLETPSSERTSHPRAATPDFGARNGTEIANKAVILAEVDRSLGRSGSPALEYIFVRPLSLLKFSRGSGTGTNPYGHAVVRYTLPDGTQKVMNIVGAPGREMVNFLKPEDYLYGTGVFDTGSEQGGVYNRGMFSVRVESLPPATILALDRYYAGLAVRSRSRQARFALAFPKALSFLARFLPGPLREYGNCALWTSKGLAAAGILDKPTAWPKELWVKLYERYRGENPANVHVVSYRRIMHAVQTYGRTAEMHGLVAPLRWWRSYRYWDLEDFSDVAVETPEGSMTARVQPLPR